MSIFSKLADLRQATTARPDDWVSECGVCEGNFLIRAEDLSEQPSESGTFCPDCRANGAIAPGVLHWTRRTPE